jgi:ribosome-associated toxin RatA of RatAB toxin-antitoxin module
MKRVLVIIFAAFLSHGQQISADMPGPDELSKLLSGKVLVLDSRSEKPGGTVRVQALAQVPAEQVWNVIVSCSRSYEFVNGLQSCEVIEDSGERALVRQVTKQGWPAPTLDFIYESLREPYSTIHFRLVQGNLEAMEGDWQFTHTPNGLLLDYEIRIKPELAVPDFMVSRSLRKSSPDMVACVRGLSGGSGSEKLENSDLKRCPGKPENKH